METAIVIVFIVGYILITIEHSIKIDKLVPALLMMAAAWALVAFGIDGFTTWFDSHHAATMDGQTILRNGHEVVMKNFGEMDHTGKMHVMENTLLHHFGKTCEILIFLVGAMTIVELVDAHEGFSVITNKIKTTNAAKLMWIICILTFFFSAILDNLTTSIVMISLLRKLIGDKQTRWIYAGMVVVAANAGGAFSPFGDITNLMVWQKGVLPFQMFFELVIP